MAVKFSMPEPFLFFILEKSGLMRIFSSNFTPSTSLSFLNGCKDPSLDADWFATDPTHVAVASGGRIHHWNLDSMRYHLPYYPPPPSLILILISIKYDWKCIGNCCCGRRDDPEN